ncbi:MAG TPA: glycosyltransferase family 39 protein [Pirellulales bacterium]|nr:glycosyltransferase family 39 protein [Pirellulales bacterium]
MNRLHDTLRMDSRTQLSARRDGWIDCALILVFGLAIYGSRIDALSLRGEESRRIDISREMIDQGNWFVQTEQGKVFAERPPLCNWLIALAMLVCGSDSIAVCRSVSVLATILTGLLVYGYGRSVGGRLGAIGGALAYLSMGQVLQLGGLAENEAVMTLAMSGSLLIWEWGYRCRWSATQTWMLGYGLAALATLAKGLQGPVYFVGAVVLVLLVRRDGRYLFSRAHLAGMATFVAVFGAWQFPYIAYVGLDVAGETWTREIVKKAAVRDVGVMLRHMAIFPLELLGCMLPWSFWLVALADRRLRAAFDERQRRALQFAACVAAVSFPTVWLASDGRARYLMPVFPCVAAVLGILMERVWAAAIETWPRRVWKLNLSIGSLGTFGLGFIAWVLAWSPSVVPRFEPMLPPSSHLAIFGVLTIVIAAMMLAAARGADDRAARQGVLAYALIMGLSYMLPIADSLTAISCDTRAAVEQAKAALPADAQLVSVDQVHHLFRYYYKQPIAYVPRSVAATSDFEYFCVNREREQPVQLDFAWEPVATVCCDRNKDMRQAYVIVGRRLR